MNILNRVLISRPMLAASMLAAGGAAFADDGSTAAISTAVGNVSTSLAAILVAVATVGAAGLSIKIAVKTWAILKSAMSAA